MDTRGFEKIGKYLRAKREAKNLTQLDVSKALGLTSQQFVSNFERGLCTPSWKALGTLIEIYGIPKREIIDLLMGEQERWIRSKLSTKPR